MEQRIEHVGGADFPIATLEVHKLIQKLNKEGYKLTYATSQCRNNHPHEPTDFMLVFTKE